MDRRQATQDEAMQLLEEFRDERDTLVPENDYEFDVVVIGADYQHARLWSCSGCGGEFIVESKADVLGHACGDGGGDTIGEKLADAIVDEILRDRWSGVDGDRSEERVAKLRWADVIDPDRVEVGESP